MSTTPTTTTPMLHAWLLKAAIDAALAQCTLTGIAMTSQCISALLRQVLFILVYTLEWPSGCSGIWRDTVVVERGLNDLACTGNQQLNGLNSSTWGNDQASVLCCRPQPDHRQGFAKSLQLVHDLVTVKTCIVCTGSLPNDWLSLASLRFFDATSNRCQRRPI